MRAAPAVAALALLAAAGACTFVRPPASSPDAAAFYGTGRSHGHVADAWLPAGRRIAAGSVLVVRGSAAWQRYGVIRAAGPGGGAAVPVFGVCLDFGRSPWPAGTWMAGAEVVPAREWASTRDDGSSGPVDGRKLVSLLAVTDAHFDRAKADPRYAAPDVPHSDDVVRQWAVWGAVGGKSKTDLAEFVAREMPSAPAAERQATTDLVWTAATVVLDVGGKAAASSEDLDWAALDLSLKP
jgi:hypothetical protein